MDNIIVENYKLDYNYEDIIQVQRPMMLKVKTYQNILQDFVSYWN